MKIFLLTLTVILLFYRIKHMPMMLSKTRYMKFIQETIDRNKKSFGSIGDKKEQELLKLIALVGVFIFECLTSLYYILLGSHIGILYFIILTVLQLLTVIETCRKQLNMKIFSLDIADFKFYRFYFLFNVILDAVYYPLAIYLLLK